jgi:hypothetical protein
MEVKVHNKMAHLAGLEPALTPLRYYCLEGSSGTGAQNLLLLLIQNISSTPLKSLTN